MSLRVVLWKRSNESGPTEGVVPVLSEAPFVGCVAAESEVSGLRANHHVLEDRVIAELRELRRTVAHKVHAHLLGAAESKGGDITPECGIVDAMRVEPVTWLNDHVDRFRLLEVEVVEIYSVDFAEALGSSPMCGPNLLSDA